MRDYKKRSDEALMCLVGDGSHAALKELYRRYSNRLLSYLYRMLGGDEDKARDFLQEIFLRIVDKAATFNPDQQFRGWAFCMASNLCKNEYRRLKVRHQTVSDPEIDQHLSIHEDQDKNIDARDLEKALARELLKLDEEHRETFLLRFQQQYTIKEISKILDCPDGTVKSRLHATTRKLAAKLKIYDPNLF